MDLLLRMSLILLEKRKALTVHNANLFTQIYSFHSFEMWTISYYKAVLVYGSSFKQILFYMFLPEFSYMKPVKIWRNVLLKEL